MNQTANAYLSRWHLCLELFGRVFIDDVGTEPHSILSELGRYDVKEAKFKREMDKLRTSNQKDLYLDGVSVLNILCGLRIPWSGFLVKAKTHVMTC